MRRLYLIAALASCTIVQESDVRERIDVDVDGVPVDRDCNDDRAAGVEIVTLEDVIGVQTTNEVCPTTLACGATATCSLEPLSASRLITSLCPDPGNPNRVLSFGDLSRVHRIDVPSGQEVRVRAQFTQFDDAPQPDEDDPPEIQLMVNRGRSCTLDSCELGYPLRQAPEENDGNQSDPTGDSPPTVWMQSDDAPLYAVVSFDRAPDDGLVGWGDYELTVLCDPAP